MHGAQAVFAPTTGEGCSPLGLIIGVFRAAAAAHVIGYSGVMRPNVNSLTVLVMLLGLLALAVAQSPALAQSRNLPRGGFQSLTRPSGGNTLPSSSGVHLSPGLDRGRGTTPTMYDPGEPSLNMATVRWEQKKMPLLIWIAPGLKLPECAFEEIPTTRVDTVFEMMQQADPMAGLEVAPNWTPEMNYVVAAGIEQWREFEAEGLLSFGFTDDPRKAHVLVFFCDVFRESSSPGGISVAGITSAQIYPYEQAQQLKIAQKPVVIELSTMINTSEEKMRAASAHEFGHALGIKAHSPYREDLMFVDRIVEDLSAADKATIRHLYRKTPKFVM